MSNIDQQFIEYVVKSLVGMPDAVQVDRRVDEKGVLLELTVDPEDLGRVIGKRGATAQSLRTLLRALGTKNDARYNLKIIDNGVGDHGHGRDESDAATDRGDDRPARRDDNAQAQPAQQDDVAEPTTTTDEPSDDVADEPIDPPTVPDNAAPAQTSNSEDEASERLARTRKELAEFDDLDV